MGLTSKAAYVVNYVRYCRLANAKKISNVLSRMRNVERFYSRYVSSRKFAMVVIFPMIFVSTLGNLVIRVNFCIPKEMVSRVAAEPVIAGVQDICLFWYRAVHAFISNSVRSFCRLFRSGANRAVACFEDRARPNPATVITAGFVHFCPKPSKNINLWFTFVPALARTIPSRIGAKARELCTALFARNESFCGCHHNAYLIS